MKVLVIQLWRLGEYNMIKRRLVKMRFDIGSNAPVMRLYGARKNGIPIEYTYYCDKYHNSIMRVNMGGVFSVIGIYDRNTFYSHHHNFPCAIIFSEII